jgi:hypothetical protein
MIICVKGYVRNILGKAHAICFINRGLVFIIIIKVPVGNVLISPSHLECVLEESPSILFTIIGALKSKSWLYMLVSPVEEIPRYNSGNMANLSNV